MRYGGEYMNVSLFFFILILNDVSAPPLGGRDLGAREAPIFPNRAPLVGRYL